MTDLHKDSVDHITIPSKMGKAPLRRVDEVRVCVCVCVCERERERESERARECVWCVLHFVDVKGHQNEEPGISRMKGRKNKETKRG